MRDRNVEIHIATSSKKIELVKLKNWNLNEIRILWEKNYFEERNSDFLTNQSNCCETNNEELYQ